MVPLQMYRLNITGFIIYKGILSQNIISSPPFIRFPSLFDIERKHLFNRPENFPMGTSFIFFFLSQRIHTNLLDHIIPPRTPGQHWAPVLWLVTGSGHGDLVTAIPIIRVRAGDPLVHCSGSGSVLLITHHTATNKELSNNRCCTRAQCSKVHGHRDRLWVSVMASSMCLYLSTKSCIFMELDI